MEEISDNEIEEEKIEKPSKRVLSEKQLEILKKGREQARAKREEKKLVKPELVRAESPEEPVVVEPKKRGRKPKAPEPVKVVEQKPKPQRKEKTPRQIEQPVAQPFQVQAPMVRPLRFV